MHQPATPPGFLSLSDSLSDALRAYSSILNELFEAAVNGGSVEFERYSMVEDLVDALADVQRCFTVLEPAEEVGL
jgi:hypothetical protein